MAIYWNKNHQRWCEMFVTADTRQEFYLYEKLHGGLVEMFGNICRRYFSISFARQDDLQEDCIQHVMLQIKTHYKPERQKAYTFAGTCIRNWLHDKIVRKYVTHYESTVLPIGEYDEINQPIQYGENIEIDIEAVRNRFKEIRKTIPLRYAEIKTNNLYTVLDACMEFIEKYESLNTYAMAEYVIEKTGIQTMKVSYYFYDLFGFHVKANRTDRYYRSDKNGHDFWNDDWCPKDNAYTGRQRRRKLNEDNYLF